MTTQDNESIRLALVITELEVGGAERCLVRLATALDRERYAPEVHALANPPQNGLLVEQLERAGVPVHFHGARNVWDCGKLLRQLNRQLERQQPHIVQSFLFHANVAVSFLRRRKWQTVFGVRVADPRVLRLKLERFCSSRAAKIVCVSEQVAQHLQRHRFDATKLVVIPNGVEVRHWETAAPMSLEPWGIADDTEVILFVGRIEEQKGVDWMLKAIEPLLQARPSAKLVLAGRGDWNRYRHLAGEQAQRIVYLGWQVDIAGLLRRSALLVLPSRWEGMPNVVLEAMAAGVPVLATAVEGVHEALGEQTAEQTIPFGDGDAFRRAGLRLLNDQPLRGTLIESNRRRVREHFSMERMVAAYDELYRELRGESRGAKVEAD